MTSGQATLLSRLDMRLRTRVHPLVRWNLAPMYEGMTSARAFVLSTPKSGRTWLRVFLDAYSSYERGIPPEDSLAAAEQRLGVVFAHDRWEHAAAPWGTLLLGRCLIPEERRRNARIVLLARDPRDAFVSLHFELSRRGGWFPGTLPEMLEHPVFGLGFLVDVMNGWAREFRGSPNVLLLRYEDLISEPVSTLRELTRFTLGDVSERSLGRAAEFSSFSHMRELEARGYFRDRAMQPGNPADPASFKVRRGEVGTFGEHLTGASLALANAEVARLDPWFGLRAGG